MKRILFVSNHEGFSKFNIPYMKWFFDKGWIVDNASPGFVSSVYCNHINVPIKRSPFNWGNLQAYRILKKVIYDNKYDIIHCHTPMGGVLTRLAARKLRCNSLKVIYTAHGFHFFKGAPIIYWLVYYPIEKMLAKYTDCLVTINKEDFNLSINKKFQIPSIEHIDGVGVNIQRFKPITKSEKFNLRKNMGYDSNDFILLYVAHFVPRKNHLMLMNIIPELKKCIPDLKILLAGEGETFEFCKDIFSKQSFSDVVKFLGCRSDIDKLCQISDVLISTSLQEGLPINIIEGMATGLPVVCSSIRGHVDIINDGINGFLYNSESEMIDALKSLSMNQELFSKIQVNNLRDVKKFSLNTALQNMEIIYNKFM